MGIMGAMEKQVTKQHFVPYISRRLLTTKKVSEFWTKIKISKLYYNPDAVGQNVGLNPVLKC
jgi:hypothetical protein